MWFPEMGISYVTVVTASFQSAQRKTIYNARLSGWP